MRRRSEAAFGENREVFKGGKATPAFEFLLVGRFEEPSGISRDIKTCAIDNDAINKVDGGKGVTKETLLTLAPAASRATNHLPALLCDARSKGFERLGCVGGIGGGSSLIDNIERGTGNVEEKDRRDPKEGGSDDPRFEAKDDIDDGGLVAERDVELP